MGEQVKLTSLDALESLRASMIVFLTRARRSLDQVNDEVRQTRQWLQHDRRVYWEEQLRKRRRMLDQVQGELMSARMSEFIESPVVQQQAVRKARLAVEEAEEKLRRVKRWAQSFDSTVDPLAKRLEGLRHELDHQLPKAITFLVQTQRTLEGYTASSPTDMGTVSIPEPETPP